MKASREARHEALTKALVAAGDAGGRARPHLETWLELLVTWNARIDLTAARSEDELVDLMVSDAVALLPHVPHGARVVDVGTGAGAPGLALALLRPDLHVTLVEPLAKRISFLRTVLGTVGRADVVLAHERGEAFAVRHPHAFDVAISRATLAPAAWVPLGLALAGRAWALLAKDAPPEVPGARLREDVSYTWPVTAAGRRAVAFERAV